MLNVSKWSFSDVNHVACVGVWSTYRCTVIVPYFVWAVETVDASEAAADAGIAEEVAKTARGDAQVVLSTLVEEVARLASVLPF